MNKMPPLPNRKNPNNPLPSIQIVSNKIKMPQRYNSIERVVRGGRQLTEDSSREGSREKGKEGGRNSGIMKRPISAREQSYSNNGRSNESRGSNGSVNSRQGSHRRRQSPHYNTRMRVSMPSISAHSWVMYQMKEQKFVYGKLNFKRRQIASLTKIMNLTAILKLLDTHNLIAAKIRINVSKQACTLIGTTAELKQNIELSLQDLFYGMMLPSGNDAAHQVAQIGGTLIQMIKQDQLDKNVVYNCEQFSYLMGQVTNSVGMYLAQMNLQARKIGLTRTSWANPHGLSNVNNASTAQDVARLCMHAMKHPQFREVVSTKTYNCPYYYQKVAQEGESEIVKGVLKWQNTNKMLHEGWIGIKTGITPNAGPCLAACCRRVVNGRQFQFLIVLLRSDSMEARWLEMRKLVDWITSGTWYIQN